MASQIVKFVDAAILSQPMGAINGSRVPEVFS
jgi:hypothetical protein